ncbi:MULTISPECIES: LysR family transcriptional regulator [environmental samples]|uniref:LysR family transcriptional regulator n=1 Tax=environmental samples TaxID=876090 RepID=UPI00033FD59A|nr:MULTISPECIES: LysR family transcriptional regulator [environmental samples]CDC67961.1 putative transcriptional regulator [Oscillibacter sp. CAG:155]
MTLRHLEIFRAVCARESITQAAEQLNMTQPAVSLAVKELEAFYGVQLLERMNRRIYITEAGRSLLQYADAVLNQFEESVRVLRDSGAHSHCSFGMTVTIGESRLPLILSRLSRELPQISIRTFVQNSRRTEQMIQRNEIDFALVNNITAVSPSHVVDFLGQEEMAAVCAASYLSGRGTLSLEELSRQPLLLREPGSGTRNSVDAVLQTVGCKAVPLVESISTASLLSCAAAGQGIAILPRSQVRQALADGSVRELQISGPTFSQQYFLVYHRNKYLTTGMKQVIQVIREEMTF